MERSVIHGSTESIVYDRGGGPWSPGKLSSRADRWCLPSIKWKRRIKKESLADFNPRCFSFCSATSRYLGLGVKLFSRLRKKRNFNEDNHDKPDREERNFLIITRSKFFAFLALRNALRCSLTPTGKLCKNAFPYLTSRDSQFFFPQDAQTFHRRETFPARAKEFILSSAPWDGMQYIG